MDADLNKNVPVQNGEPYIHLHDARGRDLFIPMPMGDYTASRGQPIGVFWSYVCRLCLRGKEGPRSEIVLYQIYDPYQACVTERFRTSESPEDIISALEKVRGIHLPEITQERPVRGIVRAVYWLRSAFGG